MTEYRIETDTLGKVKIPKNVLWGPQTERSRHNFTSGPLMPLIIIKALLNIKKAAALANYACDNLSEGKKNLIVQSVNVLLQQSDKKLQQSFPLHVYQTGSGTQTNMNVNEVIAHQAQLLNHQLQVLPNDDINRSQSSNDTFPTAMNIVALIKVNSLIKTLNYLIDVFNEKQMLYQKTVKIGRTHLQDATPITFGQEISGWKSALQHDLIYLKQLSETLKELAIGGTAVGTGLNTPTGYTEKITSYLSEIYQIKFVAKTNKFYGLSTHSGINVIHGAIKTLASDLLKIANDIRWLASGPRASFNEINIPANEPGSSIMPGKVNPTQIEALTMAAVKVMGNDTTISIAISQGNFEMNVYKPVIIETFLNSCELLIGTIQSFTDKLVVGLTVNKNRMQKLVNQSLMTVTALSPHIGYHESAKIAQLAEREHLTLKDAALKLGKVTASQFDEWVDPLKMTNIEND